MSWSFVAEQIARAMTRKALRAEVAGAFVTSGRPTNRTRSRDPLSTPSRFPSGSTISDGAWCH